MPQGRIDVPNQVVLAKINLTIIVVGPIARVCLLCVHLREDKRTTDGYLLVGVSALMFQSFPNLTSDGCHAHTHTHTLSLSLSLSLSVAHFNLLRVYASLHLCMYVYEGVYVCMTTTHVSYIET